MEGSQRSVHASYARRVSSGMAFGGPAPGLSSTETARGCRLRVESALMIKAGRILALWFLVGNRGTSRDQKVLLRCATVV